MKPKRVYMSTRGCNPLILIIIVLLTIVGGQYIEPLYAAVPKLLNYQGKLLDSSGVGINDTLTITFKLYDAATGGNLLWQETINDVEILKGLFSVELGASDGFDTLSFAQEYWLEITIGTETLTPREKLTAAPYAIKASGVVPGGIVFEMLADGVGDNIIATSGITLTYTCGEEISTGSAVYLPGSLTGWTYRQPITILNTNAMPAVNYQLRIKIENTNTDFWTNHYSPSGMDVRFTDTDGSSLLKYWQQAFDDDADTAVFWVKIPNIPAGGSKTIYLYYGNSDVTADASDFDATFTKDYTDGGLAGLWHLDEAMDEIANDQSGNSNHGTFVDAPIWQTEDGGQWDNRSDINFSTGSAVLFDGTDDYINVPHSATLNLATVISLEGWFKGSGQVDLHSEFADALDNDTNISEQSQVVFTGGLVKIVGEGNWWNDTWQYRRPITISYSGSALTDYQVLVTFDSASLISAGKMKNDCGDLRFTASDDTELNYWIESGENTSSTKVWVKVDSIPDGGTTIYVYYGNSGASSASSATTTFELYDDFEDGSLNSALWEVIGSASETGGYAFASTNNNGWRGIRGKTAFAPGHIVEFEFRVEGDRGGQATQYFGFYDASAGNPSSGSSTALPASVKHVGYGEGWCADWRVCAEQANGSNREGNDTGFASGSPIYFPLAQISWDSSQSYFFIKYSDGTTYSTTLNNYTPTNNMELFFAVEDHDPSYGAVSMYVYWVRVRKYASPSPTTTIGSEQSRQRSSGYIISNTISNPNRASWTTFHATDTRPAGTSITYSILDATGTPITGYENISNGADLSGITETAIKLKAVLNANTDSTLTPSVDSWGIDWTNLAPVAKGGNYGFGPFTNDTLAGYINGKTAKISGWSSSDWNHCVFTYDGENMRLYLNGSLVKTEELSGAIITNSSDFTIGKKFNGIVDEVRVYNRVLADDEIVCHYERRKYLETTPGYSFGTEESGESAGLLKATATSEYAATHFLGFALDHCIADGTVPVRISGVASCFSGLTPGADYYLQDDAGAIATSSGTYTKRVGTAIAEDRLLISR